MTIMLDRPFSQPNVMRPERSELRVVTALKSPGGA